MAFWSSQKLKQELQTLIDPFDPSAVENASYTLKIGDEIFVTNDHRNFNAQQTRTVLSQNQDFLIPPGQFAFLLTEEIVMVPDYAIAFISIKARYKYKGLVNISGFHVDPGFNGKLLFTLYNAGPTPIHLNCGLPFFLIWYSSLDQRDTDPRDPRSTPDNMHLPIDVLNQISTEEIYSLQALTKEFREVDTKVNDKLNEIKFVYTEIKYTKGLVWVLIVAILSIGGYVSNSIIGLGKFAIEQREVLISIPEYKEILDDLVKKKHSTKLPVPQKTGNNAKGANHK